MIVLKYKDFDCRHKLKRALTAGTVKTLGQKAVVEPHGAQRLNLSILGCPVALQGRPWHHLLPEGYTVVAPPSLCPYFYYSIVRLYKITLFID